MFKIFKKFFKINLFTFLILLFILFFAFDNVFASQTKDNNKYVIPGGDAIGLKIDTGIYVIGKYNVSSKNLKLSPWKNSDIKEGDRITYVDNISVNSIEGLVNAINEVEKDYCILSIIRGNELIKTKIDIVISNNGEKTIGLYLKDKLIGIGTLTFIDPTTNYFASLGHGIYDKTLSYGNINGSVVTSSIESIKKGVPGTSGEKKASISSLSLGDVAINNTTGVYGKLNKVIKRNTIEVASQQEVHKGKATMLTVVNKNIVESFEIEIISISLQENTGIKGLKIKVTDDKLIDVAGGIVQGMSGSPIIQDNKLVGAVSHVSISDPTIGYAMHIGWMIDEIDKL